MKGVEYEEAGHLEIREAEVAENEQGWQEEYGQESESRSHGRMSEKAALLTLANRALIFWSFYVHTGRPLRENAILT